MNVLRTDTGIRSDFSDTNLSRMYAFCPVNAAHAMYIPPLTSRTTPEM